MGFVDFTNPDACKWYQGKLQALIDIGVDSFKVRNSYNSLHNSFTKLSPV
jgi:alpha-glucosidase (family GH31 glycosyl hydrolase)